MSHASKQGGARLLEGGHWRQVNGVRPGCAAGGGKAGVGHGPLRVDGSATLSVAGSRGAQNLQVRRGWCLNGDGKRPLVTGDRAGANVAATGPVMGVW